MTGNPEANANDLARPLEQVLADPEATPGEVAAAYADRLGVKTESPAEIAAIKYTEPPLTTPRMAEAEAARAARSRKAVVSIRHKCGHTTTLDSNMAAIGEKLFECPGLFQFLPCYHCGGGSHPVGEFTLADGSPIPGSNDGGRNAKA
jgi:hypothetical protein